MAESDLLGPYPATGNSDITRTVFVGAHQVFKMQT